MTLLQQTQDTWQFQLTPQETQILLGLIKEFPFTNLPPMQVSRIVDDPERDQLLQESLEAHRQELRAHASQLIGPDNWTKGENHYVLTLNSESREVLLQLLNDVRVGFWRALGSPENLDTLRAQKSIEEQTFCSLLDLAGYFEMNLLEAGSLGENA